MTATYELISTVTVSTATAASIDFQNIPGTFTDILLVVSARTTNAATNDAVDLKINGVTTNQTRRRVQGNGSTASSASASTLSFQVNGDTATSNTFGSAQIYIPNYAGSTNKSLSYENITETNATEAFANMIAGLWSSTSAITQLTLEGNATNFKQYSSATLYGIKKS